MDFRKENSLSRVNFTGGIIGLLAGSQFAKLQKAISMKNAEGWNLTEVIPENRNLIIWILRLAVLVLTLGLWTLSTGYILVFERPVDENPVALAKSNDADFGRKEPTLSATRKPA